ncbi:MAG: carboxypeptidase regulatory-like domain-containing protein, partial [Terriglobia bacterium]
VLSGPNAPITNAVCSLNGHPLPAQGLETTTDARGNFSFPALLPGTYSLTCAALGREPVSKAGIVVVPGQALSAFRIILPPEIRQRITVHAHAGQAGLNQAAPPANFSAHELMTLPLAQLRFKAALPLVPGIVRTPDGKLSIKGTPEEQGLLLVDNADLVDPVTGAFSVEVPIDAIEELQVYKAPYLAEYGRFSGGLTAIHTKPPLDQWHWELNDLIPDVFIEQGHIHGIQGDAPRFYLTGPLIKNHLSFAESFIYDFDRGFVEGLPWPHNLTRREGLSSFTTFQDIFSSQHVLSVNVRIFPMKDEFENISALIPQSASTDYGQRGYSIGGTDHYMFKSGGILSSLFEGTEFDTYSHGQGPQPMLVTPVGFGGNYFNFYQRFAGQQELLESYRFPEKNWLGKHDLQVGGDFFHRAYSGTSTSDPVLINNMSGRTLEQVNFSGPATLSDEDTEYEAYAQDHWLVNNFLSVDYGLRFSSQNIGNLAAFAPRFGFVYSPSRSGKTVIHAGAGAFYNREALLAADFVENPTRTMTFYSAGGTPLGPPEVWTNEYNIFGDNGQQIIPIHQHLGVTPYDETWSVEVDQELLPNWLLRVSYLGNQGYDEFIVNPQQLTNGTHAFLLSDRGASRYQELESTMRWNAGERADVNFSYVHSVARGDLNTLGELYVPFEQPIFHPDFFADLPSDIPDRVITWGAFSAPWGLTLSPVFDIHNGFPYSSYNVLQNYVGQPESYRFPLFYSLDLKISKDFHLPFIPISFFRKHKFRGAIGIFDLTQHQNPVDVYDNTGSPFYGHFIGFQHMTFNTWFDLIY